MNVKNRIQLNTPARSNLRKASLATCRKLLTQLAKTKAAVLSEFRETLGAHEHLLHLALNEADALAWESGVPQLVFPMLAREKAQTLAAWHARQRSLQRSGLALAFAA